MLWGLSKDQQAHWQQHAPASTNFLLFLKMKSKDLTAEEILAGLNKPMPHSVEAEDGIVSGILFDPRQISLARLRLPLDAFYTQQARTMMRELFTMEEQDIPVDTITLTSRLRETKALDDAGGVMKVTELGTSMTSPAHFRFHIETVESKYRQRRAIEGLARGLQVVYEHTPDDGIVTTIAAASTIVQSFFDTVATTAGTSALLADCLDEHVDHMQVLTERIQSGNNPLIKTGIPTLDKQSGGIGKDEYWLVTGPTKSGKSVLTGNIAVQAARNGHRVKIYSNEVQRRTYAGRILAMVADHIDGSIERKGITDRRQQEEYGKAIMEIKRSIGKLVKLDNSAGRYVEDIVADIRSEADQGFELFIVDLIGKVRSRQRWETREREIAHISLSLYEATKRYGIALIAVSQENEDGQIRESRSPAMDCEAWLKVAHWIPEKKKSRFSTETQPEIDHTRRNLVVELARGFAAGTKIPMFFNGSKFTMREITNDDDWTDQI
jgi:replicative DNA helicase